MGDGMSDSDHHRELHAAHRAADDSHFSSVLVLARKIHLLEDEISEHDNQVADKRKALAGLRADLKKLLYR